MMLLSDTIVDFHLFYDGVLIYKYEPFWRSQCKVSDIQVTVKAHGPFVLSKNKSIFDGELKNFTNWTTL